MFDALQTSTSAITKRLVVAAKKETDFRKVAATGEPNLYLYELLGDVTYARFDFTAKWLP
jgi:hypothetical protein